MGLGVGLGGAIVSDHAGHDLDNSEPALVSDGLALVFGVVGADDRLGTGGGAGMGGPIFDAAPCRTDRGVGLGRWGPLERFWGCEGTIDGRGCGPDGSFTSSNAGLAG